MRKYLLLPLLLLFSLKAFSQIVGADTRQVKVKEQKVYTSGQAVLLNYEFFPTAATRDASIGLTYYNVKKWGYYGNIMVSIGGLPGQTDYSFYNKNHSYYYITGDDGYKTAGYLLRAGGIYKVKDSFMPYLGLGYRRWDRNWILGNGELATEDGAYQDDYCVELGCMMQFGSFALSLGIVGYRFDTFKEGVYPNIKLGIGYAF